ncbi:MAG: hypothetical protein IPK96_20870 [Flammeovirgaceae bacterium]|jgi:hypothetical protein|nr:hypothetical protein [Flammeovirgaceae bacterium]
MVKCKTGKRLYVNETLAEDALLDAHINFDYRAGSGPVAIYQCEECGNYHLTSHGEMNKRLALQLQNGFIQKQKQAAGWQDRWK